MGTLLDLLNGNGHSGAQPQAAQTRHALAYLRVSTSDQDEQAQRRDVERWAAANHVVILDWYQDHGAKANDDDGRTAF
jgi:DNA invertase Pin-like site-specific DNA recombinase